MPKATVVPAEPKIHLDLDPGSPCAAALTLAEAKELHESLGAAIREVECAGVRIRVEWGDDELRDALAQLCQTRSYGSHIDPAGQHAAVAIDCIRAVLGDKDDA